MPVSGWEVDRAQVPASLCVDMQTRSQQASPPLSLSDHTRKGRRLESHKVAELEKWAETNCKGHLLEPPAGADELNIDEDEVENAKSSDFSGQRPRKRKVARITARSGWTVQLAEQTGLSKRQVKEWVRRWRCKKYRECLEKLGVTVPQDARLTRDTFAKMYEEAKRKHVK